MRSDATISLILIVIVVLFKLMHNSCHASSRTRFHGPACDLINGFLIKTSGVVGLMSPRTPSPTRSASADPGEEIELPSWASSAIRRETLLPSLAEPLFPSLTEEARKPVAAVEADHDSNAYRRPRSVSTLARSVKADRGGLRGGLRSAPTLARSVKADHVVTMGENPVVPHLLGRSTGSAGSPNVPRLALGAIAKPTDDAELEDAESESPSRRVNQHLNRYWRQLAVASPRLQLRKTPGRKIIDTLLEDILPSEYRVNRTEEGGPGETVWRPINNATKLTFPCPLPLPGEDHVLHPVEKHVLDVPKDEQQDIHDVLADIRAYSDKTDDLKTKFPLLNPLRAATGRAEPTKRIDMSYMKRLKLLATRMKTLQDNKTRTADENREMDEGKAALKSFASNFESWKDLEADVLNTPRLLPLYKTIAKTIELPKVNAEQNGLNIMDITRPLKQLSVLLDKYKNTWILEDKGASIGVQRGIWNLHIKPETLKELVADISMPEITPEVNQVVLAIDNAPDTMMPPEEKEELIGAYLWAVHGIMHQATTDAATTVVRTVSNKVEKLIHKSEEDFQKKQQVHDALYSSATLQQAHVGSN
jgi:hypothetical protein